MTRLRVLLVVLVVLGSAAVGSYAQEALKQEDPSLNAIAQLGVLYAGSTCTKDHRPDDREFFFRPTRNLRDGWVEAEYSLSLAREYGHDAFKPWPRTMRLNPAQMCGIQIVTLTN